MATDKLIRGTLASCLTTELNSLADNSLAIGSAITVTSGEAGYRGAEAELSVTFASAPTANTACLVWFLREMDGTNYEDGSASITPTRPPDVRFHLRAVTTAQRIILLAELPIGTFKALLKNDATGRAFPASGSTLKVRPFTGSF